MQTRLLESSSHYCSVVLDKNMPHSSATLELTDGLIGERIPFLEMQQIFVNFSFLIIDKFPLFGRLPYLWAIFFRKCSIVYCLLFISCEFCLVWYIFSSVLRLNTQSLEGQASAALLIHPYPQSEHLSQFHACLPSPYLDHSKDFLTDFSQQKPWQS